MASFCTRRILFTNILQLKQFRNPKVLSSSTFLHLHCCPSNISHNSSQSTQLPMQLTLQTSNYGICRLYSSTEKPPNVPSDEPDKKKLTLFQRFKDMYRQYWYVLVPVHVVTSAFWFGGFYYLAKSGVDIAGLLEYMNVSERIIRPLRDSSMGYIAVSYALYKIATPARYAVTLGGTTVSINYLKKWGYIKPVPSKEQLKEMYREKRQEFKDKTDDMFRSTATNIKQQKGAVVEDLEMNLKIAREKLAEKNKVLKHLKKDYKQTKN